MFNILYTELLKLKRSKMLGLILIGAILPVLMNVLICKTNKNMSFQWDGYLKNTIIITLLVMAVALFALVTGFIFSREYSEKTINNMFTYPVERAKLLGAKLVIMFIVILSTFLLTYVLSIASGFLFKHGPLTKECALKYLTLYLKESIMQFALVPIAAFLSLISKNVISSIGLGLSAAFINLFVANSDKYIVVFPWSVPAAFGVSNLGFNMEQLSYNKGVISLTTIFIVSLIAMFVYAYRSDVNC
ncbi:ABC transporter permease [Clostridium ganghwense]|uniref:ABC transporter permease n=1 Tax=Clostridium ganghwense TaxID=312089 RepID=A0ABT4CNT4_9CLOT|nr:ABC transporter permease [Clostridium ganghwense]MCY6369629.1 ABC transporter permease [Clostridium ganghwense]